MTPRIQEPITRPFARIDGLPVAVHIVGDLVGMATAFAERFPGVQLRVRSGIRTYAEQERIFRERYVLAGDVRGRRVYDTRWWNGCLWYRISAVGTVAAPGTSNHETGRSVDLYDTGADAGVGSSFLAPRNIWLSQHCWRWGFTHTGRNFREPWHFEQLRVADPFAGLGKPHAIASTDPGQPLVGSTAPTQSEEDDMTPDQERKLNAIYDALYKDGKAAKDWSLLHKVDWLRRQFADAGIDSPGGPQKKWTLPHIVGWMGRVLTEVIDRVKRIETKLGIPEKD